MPLPISKNTPRLTALIIIVNLIVINLVLFLFANLDYPLIGHDYHLIIPQMLDSLLYYRNNGISIQWYTPSFGGGPPACSFGATEPSSRLSRSQRRRDASPTPNSAATSAGPRLSNLIHSSRAVSMRPKES